MAVTLTRASLWSRSLRDALCTGTSSAAAHAPKAVVVSFGQVTGGYAHSGSRVRKWNALPLRLDHSSGKWSGRRKLWELRNLI